MAIAGRSYANTPVISRSSFQDTPTATPEPVVVTSADVRVWYRVNVTSLQRNTLQDPPQLTTPGPEVVSVQYDKRWFEPNQATVIVNPQAPIVIPPTATPLPVVVVTQDVRAWYRSNVTSPKRSSLQDLFSTTPAPNVISQPPARVWFKGNPAQYFRSSKIDVPVATPRPIVVAAPNAPIWFKLGLTNLVSNPPPFIPPARSPLHLGGTLSIFELGGSVTVVDTLGGSLVGPSYAGSLVVVDLDYAGSVTPLSFAGTLTVIDTLGGSATVPLNLGGTEGQWAMQEIDITLNEFNDMTLTALLTSSGSPVNITTAEIDMFLKTQAGVADGDASTVKLSTTTGEITITNGAGGAITVVIPDTDNNSLEFGFYRIDIVTASGTLRNTALFGKVTIIPL
jgi:hypothetical protein